MRIDGSPQESGLDQEVKPQRKEAHGHHEAYTDKQLKEAHEFFGVTDKSYLVMPAEEREFKRKGIDVNRFIDQDVTSFLAPFTLDRLFGQNIQISEKEMSKLKEDRIMAEKRGEWGVVGEIDRLIEMGTHSQVKVKIGKNSNIQEVGRVVLDKNQRVNINIGDNSSLAHGVRFSFDDARLDEQCNIGNNVFVGISTKLGACNIGDNVGIGFNSIVESNVNIGKRTIICDGTIIQRGTTVPEYCVVAPGAVLTAEMVKNAISPEEYGRLTKEGKRTNKYVIQFTEKQRKLIDEAEENEEGGGAKMQRLLLQDAGVDASSLFLSTFNEIVVEENRLFPMLYRLVEKFHPDQVRYERDNVMVVNLPVNRPEFLAHYMKAFQAGEQNPKPYSGEFTICKIGENVNIEGNTALIGNIELNGETKLGQNFCCRGDEMEAGEKVVINNSEIGENVTLHASGDKLLDGVFVDDKSVIHGKSTLVCNDPRLKHLNGIGRHSTLHAVRIENSQLKPGSIILGASVKDCTIGKRNTIIGHAVPENGNKGQIKMSNVTTGERVTISEGNTIMGTNPLRGLRIGRKTIIKRNNTIVGDGEIDALSLIKPDMNISVRGKVFMDVREKGDQKPLITSRKTRPDEALAKLDEIESKLVQGAPAADVNSSIAEVRAMVREWSGDKE